MNDRNEMKGWQQMMAELTERAADKSALRTYAMTHRLFCPQWLADEGYCEAIDTMLTTFLPAVGWNYERQFYLRDVSFDPYTELPVRALADCLLAERVAHPQRRTYSVEQLLYGYMLGGFPLQADGKDICKELGLRLPYSTLDVWGNDRESTIRVPRSYSLQFRGDSYSYYTIADGEVLKTYYESEERRVWLVRDQYGRHWFCIYFRDSFDDRIERTFELVEGVLEADMKYLHLGSIYHYVASTPYFFSTENYDFILHSDELLTASRKEIAFHLAQMNSDIPPQLTWRE